MPLLVRTWNVFHGNAVPPGRKAYLREMVQLVSADDPAVVCLQEVPPWAFPKLEGWSGMQAVTAVAASPLLLSVRLGRWLTALHHGILRSAVTGEGLAILVAPRHRIGRQRSLVTGLRRVVLGVRVDDDLFVGNFHATGGQAADEQFRRVADLTQSEADEQVVLAGDVNLRPGEGHTYDLLRRHGFSEPLPGSIDQILVRGRPASAPVAWPEERRRFGRRLLSDHAPVEVVVE